MCQRDTVSPSVPYPCTQSHAIQRAFRTLAYTCKLRVLLRVILQLKRRMKKMTTLRQNFEWCLEIQIVWIKCFKRCATALCSILIQRMTTKQGTINFFFNEEEVMAGAGGDDRAELLARFDEMLHIPACDTVEELIENDPERFEDDEDITST
mmetsp:Transcript_40113/g.76671  ORF Transcript_40113/g.76671 Transcript_40113/m.76671 type:complete len:152 (+) Transcript_40113:243-698(+)